MKYRFVFALLAGFAFASISTLLLNLSVLGLAANIFIIPGLIAANASRTGELGHIIIALTVNGLSYSAFAFAFLTWKRISGFGSRPKLVLIFIAMAVSTLVGFACVPSLNLLWPQSMEKLNQDERDLRNGLRVGFTLDQARTSLKSRGIEFYEQAITERQSVPAYGDGFLALPGDRVISARVQTKAWEFPCGYVINVVVGIDSNEIIKESKVSRMRMCP